MYTSSAKYNFSYNIPSIFFFSFSHIVPASTQTPDSFISENIKSLYLSPLFKFYSLCLFESQMVLGGTKNKIININNKWQRITIVVVESRNTLDLLLVLLKEQLVITKPITLFALRLHLPGALLLPIQEPTPIPILKRVSFFFISLYLIMCSID